MRIKVYSVSEVNRYINRILEGDPILNTLSIRGEISNFKLHTSGHAYFNLKDDQGKIPCVMFKSSADKLTFNPQEGMSAIARGHVTVYEREGKYQLLVHTLVSDGTGDLHARFLMLKNQLLEAGYFDPSHKKQMPLVKHVGVVTSATGAALQDFLSVLKRRNPMILVTVYPALVQGPQASQEIASGIEWFNQSSDVDLIVVTRGGGSIEELWAFNERTVADAIYGSDLPVVSAVGHEVDFTISDFVADFRAPTPSTAAELISETLEDIKARLKQLQIRMQQVLSNRIHTAKMLLDQAEPSQMKRRMHHHIDQKRLLSAQLSDRMHLAISYQLKHHKHQVVSLSQRLEGMNPYNVLKRGYAMVEQPQGQAIKTKEALKPCQAFTVRFADGLVVATKWEDQDE